MVKNKMQVSNAVKEDTRQIIELLREKLDIDIDSRQLKRQRYASEQQMKRLHESRDRLI